MFLWFLVMGNPILKFFCRTRSGLSTGSAILVFLGFLVIYPFLAQRKIVGSGQNLLWTPFSEALTSLQNLGIF